MNSETIPETPEAAIVETTPAEEDTPVKMHAFSAYLHVGPGAESCEHAEDGACAVKEHWHGWCRLPNQFERGDLREKASAASARRLRLLRDEESDIRTILDGELELLRLRQDSEQLIEEIVGKTFLEDHLQALRDVGEEDETYETIDEDRERLRALEAMGEEERSADEFEELSQRIPEHTAKVNARREEIEAPKRNAVKDLPVDELIDIVREQRIEALSQAVRGEEYSKWEWYICTYKPKSPDKPGFPNERMYGSIQEYTAAPPEVLDTIAETITNLEREASDSLKG